MISRQTRIFVPPNTPYGDNYWAETLIGSVIAPVIESSSGIEWFWFSRYCEGTVGSAEDCDISKIPSNFSMEVANDRIYRSLRFRFAINESSVQSFENHAQELIKSQNCVISDFRDFDYIDDLGGDRFINSNPSGERRIERANLLTQFLYSVSKLFIHTLVGPDNNGSFVVEGNVNDPQGTILLEPHHLFCNITDISLPLSIEQEIAVLISANYSKEILKGLGSRQIRIKY